MTMILETVPPPEQEIKFIGSYTRGAAANPHGTTLTVRRGAVYQVVRYEGEGNADQANTSSKDLIVTSGGTELYRVQRRSSGTQVLRNSQRGLSDYIGPFDTDTVVQVQTTTLASGSGTPVCAARFWLRQVKRNSQTA